MSGATLAMDGVRVVRDGRTVLDVLRLFVAAGERIAVVGTNGAGKTTLVETMALLSDPTTGTVTIAGQSAVSESEKIALRRRMAFVASSPHLLDATVARNIALPLSLRRVARSVTGERVRAWAERFGIAGLLERHARTLSAGESARVSLARAFVAEPDILLLDEPFASLDEPTRDELMRDLSRILPDRQQTVLFVTHERDAAVTLASRIVVLDRGRISQDALPDHILEQPQTRAAARWAGFDNILAGRLVDPSGPLRLVEIAPGVFLEGVGQAPAARDVAVCFRAEAVVLARKTDELSGSMRNRFTATIISIVSPSPGTVVALLSVFEGVPTIRAAITTESANALSLAPGETVAVAVKTTAVHVVSTG